MVLTIKQLGGAEDPIHCIITNSTGFSVAAASATIKVEVQTGRTTVT